MQRVRSTCRNGHIKHFGDVLVVQSAAAMLESIGLPANASRSFLERCVTGIRSSRALSQGQISKTGPAKSASPNPN